MSGSIRQTCKCNCMKQIIMICTQSQQNINSTICKKTFINGSFQWNWQCKIVVITIVVLHFVWLHALDTVFNTELEANCWTSATATVPLLNTAHNETSVISATISVLLTTTFQLNLLNPSVLEQNLCKNGSSYMGLFLLPKWHDSIKSLRESHRTDINYESQPLITHRLMIDIQTWRKWI